MMAGCSPEEAASNWASDHGLDPAQGPLGLGHRPALVPIDPSGPFIQGKGPTGPRYLCAPCGQSY